MKIKQLFRKPQYLNWEDYDHKMKVEDFVFFKKKCWNSHLKEVGK